MKRLSHSRGATWAGLSAGLSLLLGSGAAATDYHEPPLRGAEFITLESLSRFTSDETGRKVSEPIPTSIEWNELVPSWNARSNAAFQLSIRALYPDHATAFYSLGAWALDTNSAPRASVPDQRDDDGEVRTDILRLRRPAKSFQVRLAFARTDGYPDLKSLGFSLVNTQVRPELLESSRAAWGKCLDVPIRSQTDYPDGVTRWCSPTSLTMLLAWWAVRLDRPGLVFQVPEVAGAVFDPRWPGTGNWPFNTAFAAAQPGLRAVVTRLTDITELESLIDAETPVAASVSYRLLKGQPQSEGVDGHLVVVVGFSKEGDVVLNDPGVDSSRVRRTIPRENFRRAWASSRNTIYLVWPESKALPTNSWRHW